MHFSFHVFPWPQSFLLVSDCQSGSSPLSLVSNSLGRVPHLKMEVIASRCGPLRREQMERPLLFISSSLKLSFGKRK